MSRDLSSRRNFLKNTALAGGAAAVGALSIARGAHAAGSDVLRAALVGCGGRGAGAAVNCFNAQRASGQKVQLVAMADAFEDRLKHSLARLKKEVGASDFLAVPPERMFAGLDAYQKAIDSGVDLVLLCTPPGFRPAHYAAAVKAGKHVFTEKPLCTDAPGYRSVMETNKLAEQKNLKVVVGLQRHHQSGYLQGVKEIHEGRLGPVEFLRVYWCGSGGGGYNLGPRPQNDPKELEFQIRNWGCFVWLYGDNICEQHVHNLDVANWVMAAQGQREQVHPVEANGMGGRVHPGNYGDIFDHHAVEFTYPDGTKLFSQSRHIEGTQDQVNEFVHCAKGMRAVAVGGGPKLPAGNPYDQEHVDLLQAIRGNLPLHEGWYGATSTMTGILGRMASYSGQTVRWDEAVQNGPDESPVRLAWDAPPRHMPGPDGRYPFPTPGVYRAY